MLNMWSCFHTVPVCVRELKKKARVYEESEASTMRHLSDSRVNSLSTLIQEKKKNGDKNRERNPRDWRLKLPNARQYFGTLLLRLFLSFKDLSKALFTLSGIIELSREKTEMDESRFRSGSAINLISAVASGHLSVLQSRVYTAATIFCNSQPTFIHLFVRQKKEPNCMTRGSRTNRRKEG